MIQIMKPETINKKHHPTDCEDCEGEDVSCSCDCHDEYMRLCGCTDDDDCICGWFCPCHQEEP